MMRMKIWRQPSLPRELSPTPIKTNADDPVVKPPPTCMPLPLLLKEEEVLLPDQDPSRKFLDIKVSTRTDQAEDRLHQPQAVHLIELVPLPLPPLRQKTNTPKVESRNSSKIYPPPRSRSRPNLEGVSRGILLRMRRKSFSLNSISSLCLVISRRATRRKLNPRLF